MTRKRLLLFPLLIVVLLAIVGWRAYGSSAVGHTVGSQKSVAPGASVDRRSAGGSSTIPSSAATSGGSNATAQGGTTQDASAAALANGRWTVLKRSPLGPRTNPTVLWAGNELLEFGGTSDSCPRLSSTAADRAMAAYDPTRKTWEKLASAPAKVGLIGAVSVWTGSELFVLGSRTDCYDVTATYAGLYDPATNHWTVTAKLPISAASVADLESAVTWTGQQIMVAVIEPSKHWYEAGKFSVLSYDLASRHWTVLPSPSAGKHQADEVAMVATNDGVLLWSMWDAPVPASGTTQPWPDWGVDVFRLAADGRWSNVTGSWPQSQEITDPVFTGSEILLGPIGGWCAYCPGAFSLGTANAVLVNPVTLHRRQLPNNRMSRLGLQPDYIWTGQTVIAVDADDGSGDGVAFGDIEIWHPATNRWTRGPRAPLGPQLAVWGGDRLYALGTGSRLLSFAGR